MTRRYPDPGAYLANFYGPRPRWLEELSEKQREFYVDGAKQKGGCTGRRGGKTWLEGIGLYEACRRHRNAQAPYISLSGVSARRIMWPVLCEQNERYGWGLKMHAHELTAQLPNGSTIFCVGGDDLRKVEALRGGKYARVAIDEAQAFPGDLLRYLIDDVLDAALMDLDGDLWIMGTPNASCAGHFHDLMTGSNSQVRRISAHHWTVLDNPHIPHARTWLERKRETKGWAPDNPVYLREYMGQWVRDMSSVVFRFDGARHLVDPARLPAELRRVLGIDIGASLEVPSTAFIGMGWEKYHRVTYVEWAKKYAGMIPTTGADEIRSLEAKTPFAAKVADAGALGKGYVGEWNRIHGLNVLEAEKKNKRAFIELLNDDFDQKRLLLADGPTQPLVDELMLAQWNDDRTDIDDRYVSHACEGMLYGWRHCYAWAESSKKPDGPAPGTREHLEMLESKRKEQAIRDSLKRARRDAVQRWGR